MTSSIYQIILSSATVLSAINAVKASPLQPIELNKRAGSNNEKDNANSISFHNRTASKQATEETTKTTVKKAAVTTNTTVAAKTSNSPKPASTTAAASPTSPTAAGSKGISETPHSNSASTASNTIIPSFAVPTSSSPTATGSSLSPSATSATTANQESKNEGISGGAIGGIVAAVVIIIAGIIAYLFLRRKSGQKKQRSMNPRLSKPDPFTMGFGNDNMYNGNNPYSQQPMQQNNLQINTAPAYQHQYGTQPQAPSITSPVTPVAQQSNGNQPSIAVTSPVSPSSPYNNNNGGTATTANSQFTADANNHIIAGSMMPAIVPAATTISMNGQQEPQYTMQQQYQPQINLNYQPDTAFQQDNSTNIGQEAAVTAATTAAVASIATSQKLAPTQPNSVGVFYVVATYTPTLSDEIDIQIGEQIEVLVEYDDGWCQGINLTRGQAKGVFPRHCVDHQPLGVSTTAVAGDNQTTMQQQQLDNSNGALAPPPQQQSTEADRMKRVSSMIG